MKVAAMDDYLYQHIKGRVLDRYVRAFAAERHEKNKAAGVEQWSATNIWMMFRVGLCPIRKVGDYER